VCPAVEFDEFWGKWGDKKVVEFHRKFNTGTKHGILALRDGNDEKILKRKGIYKLDPKMKFKHFYEKKI
jgi:hypothetical protein